MLRSILNLKGVVLLSKQQQKSVNGGIQIGCVSTCTSDSECSGRGATCSTYECDGGTIKKCYTAFPGVSDPIIKQP